MIQVDISNIWGEVSLTDLLSIETELSAAHMAVTCGDAVPAWLELPDRAPTAEHTVANTSPAFTCCPTRTITSEITQESGANTPWLSPASMAPLQVTVCSTRRGSNTMVATETAVCGFGAATTPISTATAMPIPIHFLFIAVTSPFFLSYFGRENKKYVKRRCFT